MNTRAAEVLSTEPLTPGVRLLRLRCADGVPLGHVAGQWVNLHVPVDGEVRKRAYSVASAPSAQAPDVFELAVTRVEGGGASSVLHQLAAGAGLDFDGPHGFFTREDERDRPGLFVGTGTGLCPLRAMLQAELSSSHGPALGLLFGCRSEEDILFRDELQRWPASSTRMSVDVTLSRPGEHWSGRTGYVQTHLPELVERMNRPIVYVCGLSRMVQEVRRVLKDELGYDRKLIRSERYD